MKKVFASHLLLHVGRQSGLPVEAAALTYLLLEEPARSRKAEEEPPPGILRRLSVDRRGTAEPAHELRAQPVPAELPPAASRMPVAARARRTPPRPWV